MFANSTATITYQKTVAILKLFCNLFAQVTLWQFKVLSQSSIIIHQMQETIWDVA